MGRFSRVKGGCGKKSEVPDLEAHFPDGAWYDIVLRAADPSRNRFLVQVCWSSTVPLHLSAHIFTASRWRKESSQQPQKTHS